MIFDVVFWFFGNFGFIDLFHIPNRILVTKNLVPDLYSVRDRFVFWSYQNFRFGLIYMILVRGPNRVQPYSLSPNKTNVVSGALSWKSSGNLTCLLTTQLQLINELRNFKLEIRILQAKENLHSTFGKHDIFLQETNDELNFRLK